MGRLLSVVKINEGPIQYDRLRTIFWFSTTVLHSNEDTAHQSFRSFDLATTTIYWNDPARPFLAINKTGKVLRSLKVYDPVFFFLDIYLFPADLKNNFVRQNNRKTKRIPSALKYGTDSVKCKGTKRDLFWKLTCSGRLKASIYHRHAIVFGELKRLFSRIFS